MSQRKGAILLTGANGVLGSAIASIVASTPEFAAYHGLYMVRDAGAGTPSLDSALGPDGSPQLQRHSWEKISLDLAHLENVRQVAASINARVAAGEIPPIRAIVLNAGYEEFTTQTWTEEGLDKTFVVNYLSHWLLALMLLQSMDRENGRIIWVSSWSHNPRDKQNQFNGSFDDERYRTIIHDDLEPIAKGTWSANADDTTSWAAGYRRYGASKLCGVTMIHELQRRLNQDPHLSKISVLAIDPGAMSTGIVRRSGWFLRVFLFQLMVPFLALFMKVVYGPGGNGPWRSLEKSGRDVVSAMFACGPTPLSEHPKGVYLNGSEAGIYNDEAQDPAKGRIIWEASVRYTKLRQEDTALDNWMQTVA